MLRKYVFFSILSQNKTFQIISNPLIFVGKMEYFSDASYDESDTEDEVIMPVYLPRELDYMELESLLDSRDPPPVIEYAKEIGVVALRACVFDLKKWKIENVVDPMSVHSWNNFWKNNGIQSSLSLFDNEDWNAIGEFSFTLCTACDFENPTIAHVQNVMCCLLSYVDFKHPK